MGKRISINVGDKYGKWEVTGETFYKVKNKTQFIPCKCECGTERDIPKNNLVHNLSNSCGCARGEYQGHNDYMSSEYIAWQNLLQRCNNPKHPAYKDYGARGITVSIRWQSFDNFFADMGSKPSSNHEINRINNDLGYSKENCEWTSKLKNMNNTRRSVKIWGMTIADIARQSGMKYKQVYCNFLKLCGDNPEYAQKTLAYQV